MKLTIIAATGGIGRELLQQAVAAGHDVTAVVRNPAKLSRPVRAITTDLTAPDQAALESRSPEPTPYYPASARTPIPTPESLSRARAPSSRR
jgi:nucleoside-diphosphate-sugar epimerase